MHKKSKEPPKCKNCKVNDRKVIRHNYDYLGRYKDTEFSVHCSPACRKKRITGDAALFTGKSLPEVLQSFTEISIDRFKVRNFVYILLKGEEVVYFGSTTHLSARIRVHIRDTSKDFDRVMYFETDTYEAVELLLIKSFKTKHNHCTTAKKAHDPNF